MIPFLFAAFAIASVLPTVCPIDCVPPLEPIGGDCMVSCQNYDYADCSLTQEEDIQAVNCAYFKNKKWLRTHESFCTTCSDRLAVGWREGSCNC